MSNTEDGGNIVNPSIDPLSPPNNTSPPLHKPKTDVDHDIIDPFIDLSPGNDSSPLASANASKPKVKVWQWSKVDQEDWDKFVEDCDLMYLDYSKKKSMPVEQVFTQYLTLRR